MKYVSSRNNQTEVPASIALIKGLCEDGGLYTPILKDKRFDLKELLNKDYKGLAFEIISYFLDDLDKDKLKKAIDLAYDSKFDDQEITPLNILGDLSILELWHGRTCAFKDVALSLLPYLLQLAYEKNGLQQKLSILTATSGDTGKAALEAFADVKHTYITVFYPEIGVSDIQKLQMATSMGKNVEVIAVKGNFDDCQRLVKKAYSDKDILKGLNDVILSSANSINIGRLVPQIVYYFYAYLKLVKEGQIQLSEEIDFFVPTGNFGDILAGYLAKKCGLPIHKLICASNSNNILTDFLHKGSYDLHRPFYTTMSPSMDILISSNLERLLYFVLKDSDKVSSLMKQMDENGIYELDEKTLSKIQDDFDSFFASEEDCAETIRKYFYEKHVLIDPHTAVACHAYERYKEETKNERKAVVLSTASPFKFSSDVLHALGKQESDPFRAMEKLSDLSGCKIPQSLSELKDLPIRFDKAIEIDEGMDAIKNRLKEINDA